VGQSSRKIRWLLIISAGIVVVAMAVGGLGAVAGQLADSGSHATIDQARLESEIQKWAVKNSNGYQLIKVDCPSDVPVKAGTNFHCIVSDDKGASIRVTVTIENDKGTVTWVQG
jgi:hypothetical protein